MTDAANGISGFATPSHRSRGHPNCNLHMLQECSQLIRIIGIVAPRREVEPQSTRLEEREIRGTGLLGRSAGHPCVPRSCDPPCSAMRPTADRSSQISLTPGKDKSSAKSMVTDSHVASLAELCRTVSSSRG